MRFAKSYIPCGGYWSTPFTKWQGTLRLAVTAESLAKLRPVTNGGTVTFGLFVGCAAGDTAAAIVVRVGKQE